MKTNQIYVKKKSYSPQIKFMFIFKTIKYQNVKEEKFQNYLKKELIYRTKFDFNHIIKVFA